MTDYYGALREAVGNLEVHDAAGRRAFFSRARRLLIERLQTSDPPVPARELRSELEIFDAAVRQIEAELQPAQPPAPRRSSSPPPVSSTRQRPAPAPPSPASGIVQSPQSTLSRPPAQRPQSAVQLGPDPDISPQELAIVTDEPALGEFIHAPTSVVPRKRVTRSMQIGFLAVTAAAALLAAAVAFVFYGGNEVPAPHQLVNISARPDASAGRQDEGANLQYVLRRQLVYYRTIQPPGTIVVTKSQHFLYVVRPDSVGLRYTFAIGPDCSELAGLYKISKKDSDAQNAKARALYLDGTDCRIRSIEGRGAIGQNLHTPGLQLTEDDFSDLFDHTEVETRVVVTN